MRRVSRIVASGQSGEEEKVCVDLVAETRIEGGGYVKDDLDGRRRRAGSALECRGETAKPYTEKKSRGRAAMGADRRRAPHCAQENAPRGDRRGGKSRVERGGLDRVVR
jgi:hypothetical protein